MPSFVIMRRIYLDDAESGREYWNNEHGWECGVEEATIFTEEERQMFIHLPIDGEWACRSFKFNTMFDVAFSIDHDFADPADIPPELLIEACQRRLDELRKLPGDAAEAFGALDTYAHQ